MILTASLVGGWHKLELWDHTHALLLGLLFIVCALEVILWKMTTSLFNRSHQDMDYEGDYEGADEYEEDIYYENLQSNYDQIARRQQRYRQRQQQEELQLFSFNHTTPPHNSIYNGHSSAAGVFRYFN